MASVRGSDGGTESEAESPVTPGRDGDSEAVNPGPIPGAEFTMLMKFVSSCPSTHIGESRCVIRDSVFNLVIIAAVFRLSVFRVSASTGPAVRAAETVTVSQIQYLSPS